MSTYLGYFKPTESYRVQREAAARNGESSWEPKFVQLVVDLPMKLPAGCQMVGTFSPLGGARTDPPAVAIVETDNAADLSFISNHYTGYLEFQWVPCTALGTSKNQREEWRQTVATPTAAVR